MKNILPVFAVGDTNMDWAHAQVVYPIKLSISEMMKPVSTATMVTTREELFSRNHVFRLYTANGLAGYYRIRSMEIDYTSDTITYELEHMLSEVGDWCVMAELKGTFTPEAAIKRLWQGANASLATDDSYRGTFWQLGDTSVLASFGNAEIDVKNRDNLLSSISKILDGCPNVYMTFDYTSATPYRINFVKMDEEITEDVAFGSLTRNVGSARISYDFTDLCTRVRYCYQSTWREYTADQTYLTQYGLVEDSVSTESESSLARAQYVAKEHLRKNQEPRLSIQMSGQDLSSITGAELDKLQIGKLFSLFVPELGTLTYRNITKMVWRDVYGDPMSVDVTLGEEDPSLWAYLGSLKKK